MQGAAGIWLLRKDEVITSTGTRLTASFRPSTKLPRKSDNLSGCVEGRFEVYFESEVDRCVR
jgi:hypothetical protein